jgi:hypothetical protein
MASDSLDLALCIHKKIPRDPSSSRARLCKKFDRPKEEVYVIDRPLKPHRTDLGIFAFHSFLHEGRAAIRLLVPEPGLFKHSLREQVSGD